MICRSPARIRSAWGQQAPQYTCEHIWWTTQGLAWPGLAAVLALDGMGEKFEKEGARKQMARAEVLMVMLVLVLVLVLVADLPQFRTRIGGAGLMEGGKRT